MRVMTIFSIKNYIFKRFLKKKKGPNLNFRILNDLRNCLTFTGNKKYN